MFVTGPVGGVFLIDAILKVQETVVSLDSEDVLAERKEKVGRTLLSGLGEQDLEEALFVVVDLLNSGKLTTSVELARLNLRAARKAKSFSAFGLGKGIAKLSRNHLRAQSSYVKIVQSVVRRHICRERHPKSRF